MSMLRQARARLRMAIRSRPEAAETGRDAGRRAGYALKSLRAASGRTWDRLLPYLTAVLSIPIVVTSQLIALGSRIAGGAGRRVDTLAAALRPELALALVALCACVALAASQFVAYSGVAVDAPGYGSNISRIAPTPITGARDAGSAHGYAMIPLALIAAVMVVATLGGRWRVGRLVALCGAIAVFVTLLVDLPQGIDAGRPGIAFGGAEARLLEGFWAQLAAASVLLFSGALLSSVVRRSEEARDDAHRERRQQADGGPRGLSGPLQAARSRWRTS